VQLDLLEFLEGKVLRELGGSKGLKGFVVREVLQALLAGICVIDMAKADMTRTGTTIAEITIITLIRIRVSIEKYVQSVPRQVHRIPVATQITEDHTVKAIVSIQSRPPTRIPVIGERALGKSPRSLKVTNTNDLTPRTIQALRPQIAMQDDAVIKSQTFQAPTAIRRVIIASLIDLRSIIARNHTVKRSQTIRTAEIGEPTKRRIPTPNVYINRTNHIIIRILRPLRMAPVETAINELGHDLATRVRVHLALPALPALPVHPIHLATQIPHPVTGNLFK
jgi:hypothetical protein